MSEKTVNSAPPRAKNGPRGGGPGHQMMPGEKAKNFKETMKTLLTYMRPFKIKLAIVVLFAIGGTVFSIVSPMVLGMATDVVASAVLEKTSVDFERLAQLIIIVTILYGISSLMALVQGYVMAGVSQRITYQLRKEISEKLDRLPFEFFDRKTHGEILSRVTNDIETVSQSLSQSMTQIITSVTTIIGILVMMIYISLPMTLVSLITLPLSILVIKFIVGRSQKHFKDQQKYLGELNGHVEEMYSGHIIVKAFNGEKKSVEEFKDLNEKLYKSAWNSQFLSGTMMPLTGFVGNLGYVFVCIVGGYLALNGRVSIGNIQAFIQYVRSFNQPVSQVANVVNILQSTAAAAERVFEILSEHEEENPSSLSSSAPEKNASESGLFSFPEKFDAKVTFENVSFGYSKDAPLIKNFNFTAEPGQRIAIVGPTGAGKTTLVKLLMRFYELNGGAIYIGNRNILDFSRNELRSCFGMVLQDTWLFNGTIEDNIKYGNMAATHDDVVAAAKSAKIHRFIKTLPGNYEMIINEDASNISQGQKQLLTIARAFLANNPILILDEATSSVDTRTEAQIQEAMADLLKGRTGFIIAHRLSTIKNADVILVINDGDIVEKGTHDQLLSKNGFYASLYNSQFQH